MITSKDAIYIELPKTASSFLENCLHSVCVDETLFYYIDTYTNNTVIINLNAKKFLLEEELLFKNNIPTSRERLARLHTKKHDPLRYNKDTHKNKLIFATIRNPWKYYVSVYTYFHNNPNTWFHKYKELNNYEDNFKWWLDNIFTVYLNNNKIGFLTEDLIYRTDIDFFKIKAMLAERINDYYHDVSIKDIQNFLENTYFNNKQFKLLGIKDNLAIEFSELIESYSNKFDLKPDYKDTLETIKKENENFVSHFLDYQSNPNRLQNLNYKEFYTDTLIDQVYELDKILIDKFNLKVPF